MQPSPCSSSVEEHDFHLIVALVPGIETGSPEKLPGTDRNIPVSRPEWVLKTMDLQQAIHRRQDCHESHWSIEEPDEFPYDKGNHGATPTQAQYGLRLGTKWTTTRDKDGRWIPVRSCCPCALVGTAQHRRWSIGDRLALTQRFTTLSRRDESVSGLSDQCAAERVSLAAPRPMTCEDVNQCLTERTSQ
jgi:hypothetical protein